MKRHISKFSAHLKNKAFTRDHFSKANVTIFGIIFAAIGGYIIYSSFAATPAISAVSSSSITGVGATIKWTTDIPSDSQVEYGTTAGYGSSTTLNSSLVTAHSVVVSGLTAHTTYHYRVKSKDSTGTLTVGTDNNFSTITAGGLLPGQQIWNNGVSSFLFGSNMTEEWSSDNTQTDPHNIVQPAMKNAHMTLMRVFIMHYSLANGHRTSIGPEASAQTNLNPSNIHEYDQPTTPAGTNSGTGYEIEKRIKTVENMGMTPLCTIKHITTTPANNTDPDTGHQRITDPDTGQPETDLDFARKVVAYLGNRCSIYEIGNEPDLDDPTISINMYIDRWTTFVHELRKINPNAKFIGPVTYSDQGNYCWYGPQNGPKPLPNTNPGDCYMRNFLHGVQGTDVEPDAISYHNYPCYGVSDTTITDCENNSPTDLTDSINAVKSWIVADLGHTLPLGLTEWNFDPGSNPVGENAAFMDTFTRRTLAAMISVHLDFATQFDTLDYSGYCHLDMFDSCTGTDQPKAQFLAMKDVAAQYYPAVTGDTTPPTVSITAPTNGSTVSGSSVAISANAADNTGVVGVQFKLDGVNLQAEDLTSPYSITLDTTALSNGTHTLVAVARDAAGNSTTSGSVSITVSNGSISPKTGDINGDNSVNITDLSLILSSYGQNTTQCITNNAYKCDLSSPPDGAVNIFDLSILLSHYGT